MSLVEAGRLWSAVAPSADPIGANIRAELADPALTALRRGYASRGFRPIWFKDARPLPNARMLVERLAQSGSDDLNPEQYDPAGLASRLAKATTSSPSDKARTDILLTMSLLRFVSDLHAPMPDIKVFYADPALRAPVRATAADVFGVLSTAPSLSAGVDAATRMNPLYQRYRAAVAAGYGGDDLEARKLLLVNLERLRALPISLGRRFILVDAATARLWMYQDGRVVDTMRVVVGKPDEATPLLAGVIRYALFNPRWNIPPDLVRRVYAPRIQGDSRVLQALHIDPWSDYTDDARELDPADINWVQVQAGTASLGLRQRPGSWNAMGAVKFMLPNELGIYLHDTPNKALFRSARRTFSAGCVRLEDYRRLALWLFGRADLGIGGGKPDQRVDLARPTPVYITYLTAEPVSGQVVKATDVYGRDQTLLSHVYLASDPPSPRLSQRVEPSEVKNSKGK